MLLHVLTLACCSAAPAPRGAPPADSVTREALVRALAPALVAELRGERPVPWDLHRWPTAIWDVRVPHVAPAIAEGVRAALLGAARARSRAAADTGWTHVEVGYADVVGDSATLAVDRGTRQCSPKYGPIAAGTNYLYHFRRVGGRWAFVRVEPDVTYDPSGLLGPDGRPYPCDY